MDASRDAKPTAGTKSEIAGRLRSIAKIVIIDVAAPLIAYSLLRSAGMSTVTALVLSGVFRLRVYLCDVVGCELSHDDRMHDLLLVFPARTTARDGQSGSRWRTEIRNSPRSRTLFSNPWRAA